MSGFRLGPFLGANMALVPKALDNNVGVLSLNHRPDRGDLRPWREPLTVKTGVSAAVKTLFMLPRDATSDTIYWMVWTTIVHAVKSFRASNPTKRFYFTGSGAPKASDNVIGIAGEPYPTAYRDLGVPAPATVPVVTQTVAGTGSDEDRFYAYCYLTDWDELGPPAVSARVTCKPGAEFNITSLAAPPSGAGENRGINRIRLFRTVTGDAGSAFYFLKDIALPATSTTDANIAPGSDTMPSKLYSMPPSDLTSLIALWNGIMAGISGNSVRYCEINKPHAWPLAYETLCKETPIALAMFLNTLLVLTTGKPLAINGDLPESMRDTTVEFKAPCLSVRSVVSFGHGAAWASADGLAYVGSSGPRMLTAGLLTPEQWKSMNPGSIVAAEYRGAYFGFYDSGAGLKGFWIDPLAPQSGVFGISLGFSAVFHDPLEGELYGLSGTTIQQWNAGAANMTASFRSKTFMMPTPVNLAIAQVIADSYPLTFTLYADARPAWVKTVTSRNPFTLPSGYLADDYSARVDTDGDITGVVVSETLDEQAQT